MSKIVGDVCYLSNEDDSIENTSGIKKIIIEEGVTILGVNFIYNLPDLEEIEFPSTLKEIGNSAITKCPKLTCNGLKFKNNDFCIQSNNSFGISLSGPNLLTEYNKKMLNFISNENIPFEEKCKIYHQIALTMNEEEQMKLNDLFLKEFEKTNYDISFIINKMNNNIILNTADLQCFAMYIQKLLNLSIPPIFITPRNQKIASADGDKIQAGYNSLIYSAKKNVEDRKNIMQLDAFMLHAIIHEHQHARQKNNSKDVDFESNDIFKQIDYIDSIIQSTSDNYLLGHGYSGFHDSFPDEIRADVDAYDVLLSIFANFNCGQEVIDFIEKRKLERIKKAHQIDESGNITVYDYRSKAFEDLLNRDDLSINEREKLNRLNSLYLIILKKIDEMGIDLFSSDIEYLKSKSNQTKAM